MRRLSFIILAVGGLAACSASVTQPIQRSARQEDQLRRALAGKVAQAPVDCLPTYRSADMEVVDDNTILFHDGANRVYVQSPRGGCAPIGSGHYTLVTHLYGSGQLCRGDISQVVDLPVGFTVGSCSMSEFIPYVKPRG
ncbi:MAG: hypothetical protein LC656_06385 [Sphingomonadales bacterium]|nr:hypothetical protein [Sphingomonadales bacterium]